MIYGKDVLVGGFVPRPLADEFTLRVYYHDSTKSATIRYLIQTYLEEEELSASETIIKIAKEQYKTWSYIGEQEFEEYINTIKHDMNKKGIASFFIDEIVKEVTKLYAEDKKDQ